MIWFDDYTLAQVNTLNQDTMAGHLDITAVEIGPDFLTLQMPVSSKTVQPFRVMHGGASATLAETAGSLASQLVVDPNKSRCVGLSINVSHIRAIMEGDTAIGTARPYHLGRSTHVWGIEIVNREGKLAAVARLTMAVLDTAPKG